MISFVIDASVVIAWGFKEKHASAELAFSRIQTEQTIAPALWWYELRNVLVVGERQGRLTQRETARFLRNISRLTITVDSSPNEIQVLTLARRHRLTVYDAAYLELALRRKLPIACKDGPLRTAAKRARVKLL